MMQTELDQARVKGEGGAVADAASQRASEAPSEAASEEASEEASKTAAKAVATTAANIAPGAGGWPVDDITGLARRLPELDPARYFDAQAKESFQQSLIRWPVLARLMKLVPADKPSVPVEHDAVQE
jgi:hypothetical protein